MYAWFPVPLVLLRFSIETSALDTLTVSKTYRQTDIQIKTIGVALSDQKFYYVIPRDSIFGGVGVVCIDELDEPFDDVDSASDA